MKVFILLLASVHPGGPSSDWISVDGASSVRFRWSRPASNSCLVEFQNSDSLNQIRMTAVAAYAGNRTETPVQPPGQNLGHVGPTIVRERKEEKHISATMDKLSKYIVSIPDCYRIDTIRGSAMSTKEPSNQDNPDLPLQRHGADTPK